MDFRRLYSGTAWLLAAKIVTVGGILGINAVLARTFSMAEMGLVLLAFSLSTTLPIVCTWGVNQTAWRSVASRADSRGRPAAQAVLRAAIGLTVVAIGISSLILLLIALMARNTGIALADVPLGIIFLTIGWISVNSIRLLCFDLTRGLGDFRQAAYLDGSLSNLFTLALLLIVIRLGADVTVDLVILLFILGGTAAVIVGLRRFWPTRGDASVRQQEPGSRIRELLKGSFSLALTAIVPASTTQISLWLLTPLTSLEETASFGIALRMMLTVSVLFGLVNQAFGPQLVSLLARGEIAKVETASREVATGLMVIAFVLSIPMLMFPSLTLRVIFGPQYTVAAVPLVVLTIAQLAQVASGPANIILVSARRDTVSLTITCSTLLLLAVMEVALAPRHGAIGAAVAVALSITVRSVLYAVAAFRLCGVRTIPHLRPAAVAAVAGRLARQAASALARTC